MILDFGVARIALADAIFDDAVADLVAVGHFDHVIAQRAHELARRGVGERPDVVFDIELALVVAMRPAVEAAVQAAFEKEATGQRADFQTARRTVGEARFEFRALQRLSERVLRPDDVVRNVVEPQRFP